MLVPDSKKVIIYTLQCIDTSGLLLQRETATPTATFGTVPTFSDRADHYGIAVRRSMFRLTCGVGRCCLRAVLHYLGTCQRSMTKTNSLLNVVKYDRRKHCRWELQEL